MKIRRFKFLFLITSCLLSFSCQKVQCTDNSSRFSLRDEYQLIHNFVSLEDCPKLCEAANKMIKTFYTEENVQNHVAFTAGRYGDVDLLKGRDSYAFMVQHSSKDSDSRLPALKFDDLDPLIQQVSRLAEEKLGLKKGKYMLNFQRYYQDSSPLSLHFDHETFSVRKNSDETVPILAEALVPKKVAVLTLINNAIGGGTKISTTDKSSDIVVEYGPSDLLVFNNTRVLHGANAFEGKKGFKPPYIRYTMGWRSMDDDCYYFNIENEIPLMSLTYEEAVEKNYDFMKNKYKDLLAYWKSSGNTQRILSYSKLF